MFDNKSSTLFLDPNKTFSDETRLSKLMRRVLRDGDRERRISATKQLKDFIHSAEGAKVSTFSVVYLMNLRGQR